MIPRVSTLSELYSKKKKQDEYYDLNKLKSNEQIEIKIVKAGTGAEYAKRIDETNPKGKKQKGKKGTKNPK